MVHLSLSDTPTLGAEHLVEVRSNRSFWLDPSSWKHFLVNWDKGGLYPCRLSDTMPKVEPLFYEWGLMEEGSPHLSITLT